MLMIRYLGESSPKVAITMKLYTLVKLVISVAFIFIARESKSFQTEQIQNGTFSFDNKASTLERRILQDTISIRVEDSETIDKNRFNFQPPTDSERVVEPLVFPPDTSKQRKVNNLENVTYDKVGQANGSKQYNYADNIERRTTRKPHLIDSTKSPIHQPNNDDDNNRPQWEPILLPKSTRSASTTTLQPKLLSFNSNTDLLQKQIFINADNPIIKQKYNHNQKPNNYRGKYLQLSDLLPFSRVKGRRLNGNGVRKQYSNNNNSDDLQVSAHSQSSQILTPHTTNTLTAQQQMLNYLHIPPNQVFTMPSLPPPPPQVAPQISSHQGSLNFNTNPLLHSLLQTAHHQQQQLQQQHQQQRQPAPSNNPAQEINLPAPTPPQYFNSINAQLPSATTQKPARDQQQPDLSDTGGSQVTYSLLPGFDDLAPVGEAQTAGGNDQFLNPSQTSTSTQSNPTIDQKRVQLGEAAIITMLENMLRNSMMTQNQQQISNNASITQMNQRLNIPSNQSPYNSMAANDDYYTTSSQDREPDSSYLLSQQPKKRPKGKKKLRSPSVKVSKRPRGGANTGAQNLYPFANHDSGHDLQPAATFHKWKDDEDEEEGETEVNIRFFNNFSRMGPLGTVARAGGGMTLLVSLIFLILSNFSLAATLIAHGVSSFLRQFSANPERIKLNRIAKLLQLPYTTSTTSTTTRPTITTTSKSIQSTTSRVAPTNLMKKIKDLDEKIKSAKITW